MAERDRSEPLVRAPVLDRPRQLVEPPSPLSGASRALQEAGYGIAQRDAAAKEGAARRDFVVKEAEANLEEAKGRSSLLVEESGLRRDIRGLSARTRKYIQDTYANAFEAATSQTKSENVNKAYEDHLKPLGDMFESLAETNEGPVLELYAANVRSGQQRTLLNRERRLRLAEDIEEYEGVLQGAVTNGIAVSAETLNSGDILLDSMVTDALTNIFAESAFESEASEETRIELEKLRTGAAETYSTIVVNDAIAAGLKTGDFGTARRILNLLRNGGTSGDTDETRPMLLSGNKIGELGRTLLFAESEYERDSLWTRLVGMENGQEPFRPELIIAAMDNPNSKMTQTDENQLERAVYGAKRKIDKDNELASQVDFFAASQTGQMPWTDKGNETIIITRGFPRKQEDTIEGLGLTPPGGDASLAELLEYNKVSLSRTDSIHYPTFLGIVDIAMSPDNEESVRAAAGMLGLLQLAKQQGKQNIILNELPPEMKKFVSSIRGTVRERISSTRTPSGDPSDQPVATVGEVEFAIARWQEDQNMSLSEKASSTLAKSEMFEEQWRRLPIENRRAMAERAFSEYGNIEMGAKLPWESVWEAFPGVPSDSFIPGLMAQLDRQLQENWNPNVPIQEQVDAAAFVIWEDAGYGENPSAVNPDGSSRVTARSADVARIMGNPGFNPYLRGGLTEGSPSSFTAQNAHIVVQTAQTVAERELSGELEETQRLFFETLRNVANALRQTTVFGNRIPLGPDSTDFSRDRLPNWYYSENGALMGAFGSGGPGNMPGHISSPAVASFTQTMGTEKDYAQQVQKFVDLTGHPAPEDGSFLRDLLDGNSPPTMDTLLRYTAELLAIRKEMPGPDIDVRVITDEQGRVWFNSAAFGGPETMAPVDFQLDPTGGVQGVIRDEESTGQAQFPMPTGVNVFNPTKENYPYDPNAFVEIINDDGQSEWTTDWRDAGLEAANWISPFMKKREKKTQVQYTRMNAEVTSFLDKFPERYPAVNKLLEEMLPGLLIGEGEITPYIEAVPITPEYKKKSDKPYSPVIEKPREEVADREEQTMRENLEAIGKGEEPHAPVPMNTSDDVFRENGIEIDSEDGVQKTSVTNLSTGIVNATIAACKEIKSVAGENAPCVVTSGMRAMEDLGVDENGNLKPSLHVTGNAIDIRARHLSFEQREEVVRRLQKLLGKEYDILWRPYAGGSRGNHIHIERDTKETKEEMLSAILEYSELA